jgi:hypothetical protein
MRFNMDIPSQRALTSASIPATRTFR